MPIAHNLGFPHLGAARELKRATEGYWGGKVSLPDLLKTGAELRARHWRLQQDAGIDLLPSNDFSYYDRMLDMCALLGAVPKRYGWAGGPVDIDTYFAMARGVQSGRRHVTAMEMTKWFDTNYHYLVPEFDPGQAFRLSSSKPVDEFQEAKALGMHTKPVLIGPVTFRLLSKARAARRASAGLRGGAVAPCRRRRNLGAARRALPGARPHDAGARGVRERLPLPRGAGAQAEAPRRHLFRGARRQPADRARATGRRAAHRCRARWRTL